MSPDGTRGAGSAPGDPLASVVVTTHDRPEFAARAIASALAQTVGPVEVVVVDDGSHPPFVPPDDPRVRLVRRDVAGGMCAARNAGLAAVGAPWVAFLDDDDEMVPDMLEHSIAAAAASVLPAPVAAMGAMAVVTPDGDVVERVLPLTLARGADCFLAGSGPFRAKNTLVMPTDLVRAIGGWDERLRYWEADDFGLRLNAAASLQGVDRVTYRMTAHPGPRVSGVWGGIAADMARTRALHGSTYSSHRAADAAVQSTIGYCHLRAGDWRAAVTWTMRGVARDPAQRRGWTLAVAALAGPRALRALRFLRRPESGTPVRALTASRVRKYGGRVLDYLRAVPGAPLGALSRAAGRRAARAVRVDATRVLVLGVYRARNAPRVEALVAPVVSNGGDVRLWALDTIAEPLASLTRGRGPGPKFRLLDRLVDPDEVPDPDWIVVIDDDCTLPGASLLDFLAVASRAGLDLVQPAHTEVSFRTNPLVRRRPATIARRTEFVEIGPVFAVRRPWAAAVVPFPPDQAMGWGIELRWWDLEARGARLGIVDAVAVRHLGRAGAAYGRGPEQAQLDAALRARGLRSLREVQRTTAVWRVGRPAPPWATG